MEVAVHFRHMEPSQPVKDYTTEKVAKVKKYIDDVIDAQAILSVEKIRHTAEINIITNNGLTIHGEETTNDMYSAIDLVMDKIEKQLRKYKDKLKKSKNNSKHKSLSFSMNVVSDDEPLENQKPKIIKTKNFSVKPMDAEEAIMQMNLMHSDFLVFTNAVSNEVNVLYRLKDGNYGLIEPTV